MHNLELVFLECLKENPQDIATRLAYNDWLLDQNRNTDAEHLCVTYTKEIKQLSDLQGCILQACEATGDELIFTLLDGRRFKLYHQQDCCENVYIEDICGELSDLIHTPL